MPAVATRIAQRHKDEVRTTTRCARKYSAVVLMILLACSSLVLIQRHDWFRDWASPDATLLESSCVWTMALRIVAASSIIPCTRAWS